MKQFYLCRMRGEGYNFKTKSRSRREAMAGIVSLNIPRINHKSLSKRWSVKFLHCHYLGPHISSHAIITLFFLLYLLISIQYSHISFIPHYHPHSPLSYYSCNPYVDVIHIPCYPLLCSSDYFMICVFSTYFVYLAFTFV